MLSLRSPLKILNKNSNIFVITNNLLILFLIGICYFGNIRAFWFLLDLALIISLFTFDFFIETIRNIRYRKIFYISITILYFIYLLNILINDFEIISLVKFYYYFKGVILLLLFISLIKYHRHYLTSLLKIMYYILLIIFFVNIPIMIYQYNTGVYHDNIDGLFGDVATPVMLLSWIALLLFLKYYKKYSNVIILIFSTIMLYLSIISYTRMYVFLLAIFWIIVFFNNKKNIGSINIGQLKNSLFFIIIISLITLQLYNSNIVQEYYKNKFQTTVIQNLSNTNNLANSTARFIMIDYSIKNSNFWHGSGLGSISEIVFLKGWKSFSVPVHLRMCEFSQLIYENGYLFYGIVVILLTILLDNLFIDRSMVRFLIINALIQFSFIYTRVLSDPRRMFMTFLCFVIFAYYYNFISKKNNSSLIKKA